MSESTCRQCSALIPPREGPGRRKEYCNPACQKLWRKTNPYKSNARADCKRCGAELPSGRTLWCSTKCMKDANPRRRANRQPYKFCQICEAYIADLLWQGTPRKYCSRPCQEEAARRRRAKAYVLKPSRPTLFFKLAYLNCEVCGIFMARKPGRVRTCGHDCQKKLRARLAKESYWKNPAAGAARIAAIRAAKTPDEIEADRQANRERRAKVGRYPSSKLHDHIRRARKVGATVERFDRTEIFVRDGWVCGICSAPIDAGLQYPDPFSASLDHIVPLSKGGAHSRANTQASHLTCNVRKNARLPGELQLKGG